MRNRNTGNRHWDHVKAHPEEYDMICDRSILLPGVVVVVGPVDVGLVVGDLVGWLLWLDQWMCFVVCEVQQLLDTCGIWDGSAVEWQRQLSD